MDKKQTIKVSTRKVYSVCKTNYMSLYAACRRLAKHELLHEHFLYDEETQRFYTDSAGNLEAPYYLKHEMVDIDGFRDFENEEDYFYAIKDDLRKSHIYFNIEKWLSLKNERAKEIFNNYKKIQEVKDA